MCVESNATIDEAHVMMHKVSWSKQLHYQLVRSGGQENKTVVCEVQTAMQVRPWEGAFVSLCSFQSYTTADLL